MGVSLSKLQNASFQSLFSSEATMQAQHYAKTKMDYLVFNGYNNLAEQSKTIINDSEFKDTVMLGTVSTDANGISRRTVTVSVYRDNETNPRARLQQVFYSNDANKFVTNGSSATSSISLNYDKDNDKLYALVDGQEKALGGGSGVPIGTVITWASWNNPTQNGIWLECNGQSCADYPKLVAVLGKNTVPDYRGRFLETDSIAGTVKEAGLPNITGGFGSLTGNGGYMVFQSYYGAFSRRDYFEDGFGAYSAGTHGARTVDFDASLCSPIYGNSTTVQPASVTVRRFIKAA